MNERNEKMAAMLAADVPARDLAFEIAVLARIEQRRFVRGVALNLAMAAGVALLLALVMPQLDLGLDGWSDALTALAGNTLVMLTLLIAAAAAWYYRPTNA
jgi:hypothetical protein